MKKLILLLCFTLQGFSYDVLSFGDAIIDYIVFGED